MLHPSHLPKATGEGVYPTPRRATPATSLPWPMWDPNRGPKLFFAFWASSRQTSDHALNQALNQGFDSTRLSVRPCPDPSRMEDLRKWKPNEHQRMSTGALGKRESKRRHALGGLSHQSFPPQPPHKQSHRRGGLPGCPRRQPCQASIPGAE